MIDIEPIYTYKIYVGDIWLGYEYGKDSDTAKRNALLRGGVARDYGVTLEQLDSEKV